VLILLATVRVLVPCRQASLPVSPAEWYVDSQAMNYLLTNFLSYLLL